jgi:FixJ family two-component response regulator
MTPTCVPAGGRRRTVLIVDDDSGTREIFAAALKKCGFDVLTASSGTDAIASATSAHIDIAVIDLRLPDMPGTDVLRAIRAQNRELPTIVISGYLTTAITVEAMKLGAINAFDKPVAVDELCAAVDAAIIVDRLQDRDRSASAAGARAPLTSKEPHSASERWAALVFKVCESDGDLKTLQEWARFTGLSYTSLREACRVLRIRPHDARDFARMLRVVVRGRLHASPPEALLDVREERTLRLLLARAGLDYSPDRVCLSIDAFLDRQRFVAGSHPGLRAVRALIAESGLR